MKPQPLQLAAHLELVARDAPSAAGRRRVRILAYSGGLLNLPRWGPVVIDLAGLTLPQRVPLLADHEEKTSATIGWGQPAIDQGRLVLEGELSTATEAGRQIEALLADGVPLAASVGIEPQQVDPLPAGRTARVNGQTFTAGERGLNLVARGTLREVSIVAIGADKTATVAVTSSATRGAAMSDTNLPTNTDTVRTDTDAVLAERQRVAAIVAACGGRHTALQAQAIAEGWTVEATKAKLLELVRHDRIQGGSILPLPARGDRARGPADAAEAQRVLTAAAMTMTGRSALAAQLFGEQIVEAAGAPSGWPELCAQALRLAGQEPPTSRPELIRAAFSTTNLSTAIGQAIEKVALQAFTENSANWRPLAKVLSAASFREGKAVRLSAATHFQQVGADGELKFGVLDEESMTFQIATFGKIFGINRQTLINDDLGILSDLPNLLGQEAARTVSDEVFAVLTGAGSNFFSATKKNYLSGSTSALSLEGLAAAVKLLRTQTDADGRLIGLVPQTLVVPAALEMTARQLLSSIELSRRSDSDQLPTGNPLAGLNLNLVVEPRLDANSQTAWYLFAGASDGALLVAFLAGRQSPTVEQMEPPAQFLGVQWRAFLDFGAALGEYRAVVKAAGA